MKRINQHDYTYYVVVGNHVIGHKIESGWSYRDDAKDHLKENLNGTPAKVLSKRYLKSHGLDPENNASWLTT